jgi:hypothetical protein
VLLRRSGDYDDVLRELGGELFAREGEVDSYFKPDDAAKNKIFADVAELNRKLSAGETLTLTDFMLGVWVDKQMLDLRTHDRIAEHIRWAPAREREALRRASTK